MNVSRKCGCLPCVPDPVTLPSELVDLSGAWVDAVAVLSEVVELSGAWVDAVTVLSELSGAWVDVILVVFRPRPSLFRSSCVCKLIQFRISDAF